MKKIILYILLLILITGVSMEAKTPNIKITGDWEISVEGSYTVTGKNINIPKQTVRIQKPTIISVKNEKYENLGIFEPDKAFWCQGVPIKGVFNGETGARLSLVKDSFVLKGDPLGKTVYELNKDYGLGTEWGFFGRLENRSTEEDRSKGNAMISSDMIKKEKSTVDLSSSSIKEGATVYADYKYAMWRIDTVATDKKGNLSYFKGEEGIQTVNPPILPEGLSPVLNIFHRSKTDKISDDMLYPVSEMKKPVGKNKIPAIKKSLPRTYDRLTEKKEICILFWGDSVTCGGTVSDFEKYVWQNVAARAIQKKYPDTKIRFETTAWGGRGVGDFFATPKGEKYNFQEHVLDLKPDLVIMEFVNDTYQFIKPEMLKANYDRVRDIFAENNIDWIILLPHFTDFDRDYFKTEKYTADMKWYDRWIREEYVKKSPNIEVADADILWGHLLYEGIPYCTLNKNGINHPNDYGHQLLADAVINLF